MLVRPRGRPTTEGLSHNGETAEGEDEDMSRDEVAQGDGCVLPDAASETEGGQEQSDSADEADEAEDDGEGEEGRMSVGRSSPEDPTKKQREEHERTHMPYRSGCEDCVKARAGNAPHHKRAPEDHLEEIKVPKVHMDYFFMSREDEAASNKPMLVMVDERSGARYAWLVGQKRSRVDRRDGLASRGHQHRDEELGTCGRNGRRSDNKVRWRARYLGTQECGNAVPRWCVHPRAARQRRKGRTWRSGRGGQDYA